MRILVVEDQIDAQEVFAALLEFAKIDSDAALNAEDALAILSENSSYDAIVVDLALPGMDGLQFLSEVRKNPTIAHLPCVAVTAYHNAEVRHEAMAHGFDAYIPKPIDETQFPQQISQLIAR